MSAKKGGSTDEYISGLWHAGSGQSDALLYQLVLDGNVRAPNDSTRQRTHG
jgi:hypothetical protein